MTAQEQLNDLAAEYGWRILPQSDGVRFKRVGWVINVVFTKAGVVHEATRDRLGTNLVDTVGHDDKGKFDTVYRWLRKQ